MDSSSTPDLDSTSNLLGDLDLVEKNPRYKSYKPKMDNMEIDLCLEVPDTPDRLAATCRFKLPAFKEDIGRGSNESSSDQRTGFVRKNYAGRSGDSGSRDVVGSGHSRDETEFLFKRASLARLLSEDLEGKNSSRTHGTSMTGQKCVHKENGRSLSHSSHLVSPTCRDSRRNFDKELYLGSAGSENRGSSGLLVSGASLTKRSSGILPTRDGNLSRLIMDTSEDKAAMFSGGNPRSDKGKGIDVSMYSQNKSGALSRPLNLDVPERNAAQRRLVHNGRISPCTITKPSKSSLDDCSDDIACVNGGTSVSSPMFNGEYDRKEMFMDAHSLLTNGNMCQSELDACPRRNGQRRLVRNGCISPYNIVMDKNITKTNDDQIGKNVSNNQLEAYSPHKVNIVSPDSNERSTDKRKGKAILNDDVVANFQHVRTTSPRSNKEVTDSANYNGDAKGCSEDKGWRTTHNRTVQSSIYSSEEATTVPKGVDIMDIVDDSPEIIGFNERCNSKPDSVSSDAIAGGRRNHGRQKHTQGKRKSCSIRSHRGASSSSAFEDSEVYFVGSSVEVSNWKSSRTRNSQQHGSTSLGPVIEVDELSSPEVRDGDLEEQTHGVSNDSSVKAMQVESDEILARQLQEQLFNESPVFGSTEMDATIALSLQQEEDSQRTAFSARRGQSHPRDTTMAHLYAHYPRTTARNSSSRPAVRARVPTSSRMAQLRRSFNDPWRDIETRLNFLEALEAEFNNRNNGMSNNIFQLQRDFNEDDYEMLLALDDNNQQVGASQNQINSLPQSVVQNEAIKEACAICLDTPTTGDTIRHLPCLHKFHKDCIDTWLKRKSSCPVCKCDIT